MFKWITRLFKDRENEIWTFVNNDGSIEYQVGYHYQGGCGTTWANNGAFKSLEEAQQQVIRLKNMQWKRVE